jgi:hypothetical protein
MLQQHAALLLCCDIWLCYDRAVAPQLTMARPAGPPCRRNVSALPLAFSLKVPPPFTAEATSFRLEPQEEATTAVCFDPDHRGDLQRCSIAAKMQVGRRARPRCTGPAGGRQGIGFPLA